MTTQKEYLLQIKKMAKNGKYAGLLAALIGLVMFFTFATIENKADKALMILDQGKFGQTLLK